MDSGLAGSRGGSPARHRVCDRRLPSAAEIPFLPLLESANCLIRPLLQGRRLLIPHQAELLQAEEVPLRLEGIRVAIVMSPKEISSSLRHHAIEPLRLAGGKGAGPAGGIKVPRLARDPVSVAKEARRMADGRQLHGAGSAQLLDQ